LGPIINLANLKAKQGTINLPAREEYWPSTKYLEVTLCIHFRLIPFTNNSHHRKKTRKHDKQKGKVPFHSKAIDCARESVVLSVEEGNNVGIGCLEGSTEEVPLAKNNADFAARRRRMMNDGEETLLEAVIEDDMSSGQGNRDHSFCRGHGIGNWGIMTREGADRANNGNPSVFRFSSTILLFKPRNQKHFEQVYFAMS
jgi:hypothetical protein